MKTQTNFSQSTQKIYFHYKGVRLTSRIEIMLNIQFNCTQDISIQKMNIIITQSDLKSVTKIKIFTATKTFDFFNPCFF